MEIENYIDSFKKDNQFRLEISTLKSYEHTVRQFHYTINKPLKDVTKRDIRSWLNYLSEMSYKPNTIQNKLTGLKAFFKYCYEEGFLEKNPVNKIRFMMKEVQIPRYLTKEQLTSLREFVKGKFLERAMIEVLYGTGVRISELIAMEITDINWQERSIFIPKGKGKKERIVLFNRECEEHLRIYLDSRKDNLPHVFVNTKFNRLLHYQSVSKKFQSYSEQLGFHVHSHLLRHTFAAHLAQKGMPLIGIQCLLGHENTKTTYIYAKLYNQARKEMYDQWM